MKYMMFVCTDTEPETDESQVPGIDVWVAENDAAGRRLEGNELAPTSAATTVRVRGRGCGVVPADRRCADPGHG